MHRSTFATVITLGSAMLLILVVAARADDLSDQHHPNAALQQKLDLLDRGPDNPDLSPPSPDVGKGSFPRSVRIPGTNTSIRVYGSGTETLQYSR
jgi:hypothetical protein